MGKENIMVLSPDGINIEREVFTYDTEESAENALTKFIERYRTQGYYSSAKYGRIPFNLIRSYCRIKGIDNHE